MGCSPICSSDTVKSNAQVVLSEQNELLNNNDDNRPLSFSPGKRIFQTHSQTRTTMKTISTFIDTKDLSECFPPVLMLKEINFARTDPVEYSKKITSLKDTIIKNNDKTISNIVNKIKGEPFDKCIQYLLAISKRKRLKPLLMDENLKIPFPVQNPLLCVDKDYIKNIIMFKTGELEGRTKIIDFHYDICLSNPEISTMMQIIDDTNSNFQRRKNIFNPKAKSIGISEGTIKDNLSCYYLMFAE